MVGLDGPAGIGGNHSGSRLRPYLGPVIALLVVRALGAGTVYAAIPNGSGKYCACYVKSIGLDVKVTLIPTVDSVLFATIPAADNYGEEIFTKGAGRMYLWQYFKIYHGGPSAVRARVTDWRRPSRGPPLVPNRCQAVSSLRLGRLPLGGRTRRGDGQWGPGSGAPSHPVAETDEPCHHAATSSRAGVRLVEFCHPVTSAPGVVTNGDVTAPRTDGRAPLLPRDGPRSEPVMATRPIEVLERRLHRATTDGSTVPTPCTQEDPDGPCHDPFSGRCAARAGLCLHPVPGRPLVRAAARGAPARQASVTVRPRRPTAPGSR